MTTSLSTLMQRVQADVNGLTVDVPDDRMQGRSVFGGLQLALALRAMRELVPGVPLQSLQMTFIAPVAGRVDVRARLLRTGKSATQVEARIVDGESTAALVVGVFGAARTSTVRVAPVLSNANGEAAITLPMVPGLSPNYTQHFDMRLLRGNLPMSGGGGTEFLFEFGVRDEGMATESHVTAIADALPPLALSYLKAPAAVSTLTWMIEFLVDRFDTLSLRGWRVDAKLVCAGDGYTSQSMTLWGPDDIAVAVSHQSVAIFG